ncbi:MAG: MFS transporter [Anaerolineae bacterium]
MSGPDSQVTTLEPNQVEQPANWKATFFTIWIGQAFSIIGSSVATFALVWWLTKLTGSATILATATLVAMLPGILIGPFAGACIDRWNRRWIMVIADGAVALVSAWLAFLFWTGTIRIWHVYVISLARSVGGCFHWPAMQASTSLMVPKQHLTRVSGLNQTINGALNIISPPLGALLLSLLPMHAIMAIDVLTAAIAISPLLVIRIPQPPVRQNGKEDMAKPSLWQDLREGLTYVRHWPGVLALMAITTVANFVFNPAFSLLPLLVNKHFGGEAAELGWANSAWAVGIVVGGLVLSAWGGFRRRIKTSLIGLLGMSAGVLVVGLAPASAFWLALAGILLAGFMNPIGNGPLIATFQAVVAPEMQGRVFTLLGSAAGAMSPLSLAIAGPVADVLGVRFWYILAGVICLLMGTGGLFWPALMHVEDAPVKQAANAVEDTQGALLCAPTSDPPA